MGVMRDAKMYIDSQKYQWLSFLTYRAQALVWLVVFALAAIEQLVVITVIYDVSSGINGWSYYQMLALGGLASMLIGVIIYNLSPHSLVRSMRSGQFDQRLVKPYDPVLFLLANSGTKSSLGQLLTGVAIFAYGSVMAHAAVLNAAIVVVVFVLGAVNLLMLMLVITLASYVLFRSAEYVQWATNVAGMAASYPLTLYGLGGVVLLTVGFPIGLASFYPAEILFGKIPMYWAAAVIAAELLAVFVYYKASAWLMTKYTSGGG